MTESSAEPGIPAKTSSTPSPEGGTGTAGTPSSSSSSSSTISGSSTAGEVSDSKEGKASPKAIGLAHLISALIGKSPLALKGGKITGTAAQGVFIANPWKDLNRSKIGKLPGVDDVSTLSTPPCGPESATSYVSWGLDQSIKTLFYGQCDAFACVSASILVADGTPIEAGLRVEVLNLRLSYTTGHALLVVDRAPDSDLAAPDTWGSDTVIVDQWYALQVGTAPAFTAFGSTTGTEYRAWLINSVTAAKGPPSNYKAAGILRAGSLVTGAFPKLKVNSRYRSVT